MFMSGSNLRWVIRAATLFVMALSFTAYPQTSRVACPEPLVQVVGASASDAAIICHGAADAIEFFRARNLMLPGPIEIWVRTILPREASPTAAGCFIENGNHVVMLPYAEFRKGLTWFKVPITESVYRSLATHEVAHAVAACNFSIPGPTIQAKEYVAYVVMFLNMETGLRERVMGNYPGPSFEEAERLTRFLCLVNPMRFGLESFKHYLRPENGDRFLKKILKGAALLD